MKKEFIKNKKGQKISSLIEENKKPRGLVFVMHGLSGFKEQPHIQIIAEAFKERGYTVVRFDTTNTFGESDGNPEEATITSFFSDLKDVLSWAKQQKWYQEPFCLAGHSLGGISTALYAENYPEKIKALAPISTVISGKFDLENLSEEKIKIWKKTGWIIEESKSRPGLIKKITVVPHGRQFEI